MAKNKSKKSARKKASLMQKFKKARRAASGSKKRKYN